MFDKKYKQAMDKVTISEEKLSMAISNTVAKPKPINAFKLASIACLSTAIICASIFSTLKISQQGNAPEIPNNFDELQSDSVSSDEEVTSDISNEGDSSTDTSDGDSEVEPDDSIDEPSNDVVVDTTDTTEDGSGDETSNTTEEPIVSPEDPDDAPSESDDTPEASDDTPAEPDETPDEPDDITEVPPSLSEQGFKYAENYKEIYEHLYNISLPEIDVENPSEPEDFGNETAQYSDTIVTNSETMFILKPNDKKVVILSTKNGTMKHESEIQIDTTIDLQSLLLSDNTLAIIGYSDNETLCLYYDVSNINSPIYVGSTSQSGKLIKCMSKNGIVYLITNTPDMKSRGRESNKKIPLINKKGVDYRNVIILDENQNSFIVITAYDIQEKIIKSDLTILGFDGQVYCSHNYIYIAYSVVNSDEPAPNLESATASSGTKILKISFSKKRLIPTAAAYVEGVVYNNLSMSESESAFRIITTAKYIFMRETNGTQQIKSKSFKRVYCLDNDMNIIGTSEAFATNLNSTDMGFIGDAAYVHTYKKPSYIINVSNPYTPSAVTELDIYKQKMYRYPCGNSHLLVITDDSNGSSKSIELSLFNVNSYNPVVYNYSWKSGEFIDKDAIYDSYNVMIDEQYGIIAIPFSSNSYDNTTNVRTYKTQYKFFTFNNDTITPVEGEGFSFDYYNYKTKTINIDGFLYFITEHDIFSVSTEDFSIVSKTEY